MVTNKAPQRKALHSVDRQAQRRQDETIDEPVVPSAGQDQRLRSVVLKQPICGRQLLYGFGVESSLSPKKEASAEKKSLYLITS